jgi:DNA-binding IclR family transcriptional regulator
MGVEDDVSANAGKVYRTMKDLGYTSEEKMGAAERVTQTTKLPKNMVLNALQELQAKGYARRKVREKTAGYYLTR